MGTHYRGRPAEVRALDAFIKLTRATSSVGARLAQRVADAGLTATQLGVLEALLHLGPLRQRVLGEKLLMSGGNITTVVDNLERRRLVRRERHDDDRRNVTVHLTAEGRRLIAGYFPAHAAAIAEELSVLSAAEQEELARLAKKLGLGRAGGGGDTSAASRTPSPAGRARRSRPRNR
jgi:MarR family transcriptional regulator, 2-MHQ and catechol-resistance regulon repressor